MKIVLKANSCFFRPQAPVAQKIADEVGFRHFQGEGVEFFQIGPLWPPSDFWCASFEKYQFKPFQLSFSVGFYVKIMFWVRWFYSLFEWMTLEKKRTMFIHTNQPLVTSFCIKKVLIFCRISDESALIRNFLRNGRVRGFTDRTREG